MAQHLDVAIIGGGLAGLACARRLAQCDIDFHLFEAAESLGGRVRTDSLDGFRLDHGFQVFLPAYPEASRVLDYDALDLKPFISGAIIRYNGKFHRVADPRSEPWTGLRSLFGPIGTIRDKLRLVQTNAKLKTYNPAADATSEQSTIDWLRDENYSEPMIERLFRPFFAGVCFDPELMTTSRFCKFVFRCFALGGGVVPAQGMQAIPNQLAANIPSQRISVGEPVQLIDNATVVTANKTYNARCIILATDMTTAHRLMQRPEERTWNASITLYYATPTRPITEPILYLNAEPNGIINNVVSMSEVSHHYAPQGESLLAVSLTTTAEVDIDKLRLNVETELQSWFGNEVRNWRFLKAYHIPHSLPNQGVGQLTPWQRPVTVRPGLYLCGDHRDNASIDGALTSGYRTAQTVMDDLHYKRA